MNLAPITLKRANAFVQAHHRHSGRTSRDGGKWAVAVVGGGEVVGVAIVGNPVSATLMDGWTAEVLRVCTLDTPPVVDGDGGEHAAAACSKLYAACWRAWKAMGGRRMVTYTLQTESGTSLRAAGWRRAAACEPRAANWNKRDHLDGRRKPQAVYAESKWRWEVSTGDPPDEPNPARHYGDSGSEDLGLFAAT